MRKVLTSLLLVVLLLALAACGTKSESNDKESKVTVGASNTPHAIILEEAKPLLKEKGIELVIESYVDYVMPNTDLESGDLDANFFQHIPYLDQQIEDHGFDFVNAGSIHIEPMALYSTKFDAVDDLPDGATILFSNSVAEHGRVLSLLESLGLIKLAEDVEKVNAEIKDIVDNPKNLVFEADVDPSYMPQLYKHEEGDALVINSNYAIDAGLNPLTDSIGIEDEDSPYANIITVNAGDEDKEEVKALVEVLKSKEIQDFILEEWGGSVVPVK